MPLSPPALPASISAMLAQENRRVGGEAGIQTLCGLKSPQAASAWDALAELDDLCGAPASSRSLLLASALRHPAGMACMDSARSSWEDLRLQASSHRPSPSVELSLSIKVPESLELMSQLGMPFPEACALSHRAFLDAGLSALAPSKSMDAAIGTFCDQILGFERPADSWLPAFAYFEAASGVFFAASLRCALAECSESDERLGEPSSGHPRQALTQWLGRRLFELTTSWRPEFAPAMDSGSAQRIRAFLSLCAECQQWAPQLGAKPHIQAEISCAAEAAIISGSAGPANLGRRSSRSL